MKTARLLPEQHRSALLSSALYNLPFNWIHIHFVTPSTEVLPGRLISHQALNAIFCLNLDRLAPLLLSVFLFK